MQKNSLHQYTHWNLAMESSMWHKVRMHFGRVIITGASSGFGAEFSRRTAPNADELVLTARRTDRLHALANELQRLHPGLRVMVIPCDLSNPASLSELKNRLTSLPPTNTLIINNAGLGDYGDFLHSSHQRTASMLAVNITATTELTHTLLPVITKEGGGIINVASLAADLPIPDFAVYAASKAYVASFSEALRIELKEYGVPVTAVCPGPVHTEFGSVARRKGFTGNMTPCHDLFDTTIHQVVRDALRGLRRHKPRVYPSFKIRCAATLIRILPLPILRLILAKRPRRIESLEEPSAQ